MTSARIKLMQGGLKTLHTLKVHTVMRPFSEGLGMIVTLHRVRPTAERIDALGAYPEFDPNGLLEITPEFLDEALKALKLSGLSIVSFDEMIDAVRSTSLRKGRVAAITFDDGYIDNQQHALPVLEAHNAPAMIYMPSDYPQGRGELWWVAIEQIIRRTESLLFPHVPEKGPQQTRTSEEKLSFYLELYWHLRAVDQDHQRSLVREMCADQGFDMFDLCRQLIVDEPGLKQLHAHPLISIGAHTMSHRAIAALSPDDALAEMSGGADWLEGALGARPKHFAFPYGDSGSAGPRDFALAQQAGFESAVTTRKGMIYREHRDSLFGLPRVSLNGNFQDRRYLEVFASGAPFLLANRLRKVA
ncbi:MAG: polysaccharide deacetylase family protein [Pseudomonadota bacterium]